MKTSKRESRFYPYMDKNGRELHFKVTYTLDFTDRVLMAVRNEYGYTVEPNSECWEFFNNKYND